MDGYEFTRLVRETDSVLPILMVTAKHLPADEKKGFLVGTNDYITKPIDEETLLLRIKALLRRAQIVSEQKITIGDVVLDYNSFTVTKTERRRSCRKRSSCSCINCFLTLDRSLPEFS